MIASLRIQNFRGFRDLTIQPVKRVNLIAGKNNTGKTAFLEALLLHNAPTNPQVSVNIQQFRGIEEPGAAVEDVCRWMFSEGIPALPVEFESSNETGQNRKLLIRMISASECRRDYPDVEKLLIDHFHPSVSASDGIRMLLTFEPGDGTKKTSVGVVGESKVSSGMLSYHAPPPVIGPTILLSSNIKDRKQTIDAFGELELNKRVGEIIPALAVLEPRLRSLRLIPLAGDLVIHGDVGLPQLIPLPMMGDGLQRAMCILLAIGKAEGGTVLIDELENGIHYSVLGQLWDAIAIAANRLNVQVFATTHGWECLEAARSAFAGQRESELAVHRLERDAAGQVKAVTMDYKAFETAIELGWELR